METSPPNNATSVGNSSDCFPENDSLGSRRRPNKNDWGERFFQQTPPPYRHLNAMFGLGVVFAIVLLVFAATCFYRTADIDSQLPLQADYRVSINTDRWVEFANLPRIGEKTARSIVEYGKTIGGYRSVDQLLNVKGVGHKTLAAIRPNVILVDDAGGY